MPAQPQSMKCVIWNDTDCALVPTLTEHTEDPEKKKLNFKLLQGDLDPSRTSPPSPIAAGATESFTVTTAAGSTSGPDGWICYELATLNLVVEVIWKDPSAGSDAFQILENRLDGARRELDPVAVTFTDDGGQDITLDKVKDASSFVAKFTVRLKPGAQVAASPQVAVVDTSVAGPPGGNAGVTVPSSIRKWDDARMTSARKRLLAVIGNLYPMMYWPDGGAVKADATAAHGGGHYRRMTCWFPGPKSGTSCTGTNVAVGNELTGHGNKWAFDAHLLSCWVAWGTNPAKRMPSVGDIYILYRDKVVRSPPVYKTDVPHERHCGFILQVPKDPTEKWVTADGGQNDSTGAQAAFLNARPWELRVPGDDTGNKPVWEATVKGHGFPVPIPGLAYPYLGGGAEAYGSDLSDANRLLGWVDMDALTDKFIKTDFDAPQANLRTIGRYTQADYEDLGRRINTMT